MKNICFFLLAVLLMAASPQLDLGKGSISLTVLESDTKEPVPFVNVAVLVGKKMITGAPTDIHGKALINNLDPGVYSIQLSAIGMTSKRIDSIVVERGSITSIPKHLTELSTSAEMLQEIQVVEYKVPVFEKDQTVVGSTITKDDLVRMPARSAAAIAATAGGVYSSDDGSGNLNIRGVRQDANYVFIDGIKVRGSNSIPQSAVEEISVITGGLPAQYENYEQLNHSAWTNVHVPGNSGYYSPQRYEQPAIDYDRHVFDLLMEDYEYYRENEFKLSAGEELSTFSIDVDHGSYTNVRRIVNSGYLPPLAAVRLEEFVNYFPYEPIQKDDEHPFIVDTELGDCPWNSKHHLLKVTLQGDQLQHEEAPASNLVFLIDVSGSMDSDDKLGLIKRSFELLTNQLRPQDRVSIVVYAGSSGVVIDGATGKEKQKIKNAIHRLSAGGSTAGGQGIQLAYKIAEKHFIKGGNNRVILATDGDFNVGVTSNDALVELIEEKRESGVLLSTIGCGSGNYEDAKMEQLADHGNGSYAYIDTYKEARKVFLKELTSSLYLVAKDVKFQIEFNPNKVHSYRLLGYENRVMADEDFDDDTKDAGELGAGQMVTAFYELVPVGIETDAVDHIQKRYKQTTLSPLADSEEWLNLKIRYKLPESTESTLIEEPVVLHLSGEETLSESFRFGSAVVEFGLLLRHSKFLAEGNINSVLARANKAIDHDPEGYRREFIQLAEMCQEMYASVE